VIRAQSQTNGGYLVTSQYWYALDLALQRSPIRAMLKSPSGKRLVNRIVKKAKNAMSSARYRISVATNWYGITVNYQIDSNYYKTSYSVYLDKFTFSAW